MCEERGIKEFCEDVLKNWGKGFGEMWRWVKKNDVVVWKCVLGMELRGRYWMEVEKFVNGRKYELWMVWRDVVKDYGMGGKEKREKIECGKIGEFVYGYNGSECVKGYNMGEKRMERVKGVMNEGKLVVEEGRWLMKRREVWRRKEERELYDG